jgi:hypothetical protein
MLPGRHEGGTPHQAVQPPSSGRPRRRNRWHCAARMDRANRAACDKLDADIGSESRFPSRSGATYVHLDYALLGAFALLWLAIVRVAAGRARFVAARGLSSGACRRVRCRSRAVPQALQGRLRAATQLHPDVPPREIPVLRALSETFIQEQIMKAHAIVVILLAGCAHVPSPAELAAAARQEEECREACLVKHRACLAGICSLGCPMSLFTCTASCSPVQRAALSRSNYPRDPFAAQTP